MAELVDDVGSFPLPLNTSPTAFDETYRIARNAIAKGHRVEGEHSLNSFRKIIIDSFLMKARSGLDVVNYPQHYDMHRQLADVVRESMNEGTYSVEEKNAVLPEVQVICDDAKRLSEEMGGEIKLRVCLEGPIEFYLKEIGLVINEDILRAFAENVKLFAQNSILKTKYVETVAVSLDEPSFGFQDPVTDRETIQGALETAFSFSGAIKQIHLHSPSRITDLLGIKSLDVLSLEFAASPRNIESVSKSMLDQYDKQIRVGISRTDIDSILAELRDKGIERPEASQIVEDERIIRKRHETAKAKFGNRMTFTGPDCGLGGWPTQEAAQLLLITTVKALKTAEN